jgi:hypothetical protein
MAAIPIIFAEALNVSDFASEEQQRRRRDAAMAIFSASRTRSTLVPTAPLSTVEKVSHQ